MNDMIHKNEYMRSLFRFIENNLLSELDIERISNVGYVSYDKLYRDFYGLTGYSVKEYVRRRRLSNALALIKTSDFPLTDIALQCGYSSHQALCRAVRQTLGLTPSEYKNGDTYYFFPPWSEEPLQSVTVSGEAIPETLRILFYHPSLKNIENTAVNAFLNAFPDYGGRIFGRNGEQAGSKLCYELYLTDFDRDLSKLNSYGFEISNETPCYVTTFAVTTVKNDEKKINAAWDYLYSAWLQNSMFEYTGEAYFEEYILRNGKSTKLKLYLPIKKRNTETKINVIKNPGLRFITAKAEGYDAEKLASKKVIDYLSANYPYIVKTSRELYLRKESDAYVCGVRISPEMKTEDAADTEIIITGENNYLMLESRVMGDYDRYAGILLSFARDNGMDADKNGLFAVYDAKDSFDNLKIKIYCPVKIRKK
jgi:AraC-like DNA-binding protein/effector-binding domain-containing protein